MIPGEKKPLVGRALREAFDVTEFEEIQMLTAGLSSALVFRIAVCAGAHESEFARDAFGAICEP